MKGPCLCGDPYCPSCGSPGLADLEAAEEALMESLSNAQLSAEEYKIVEVMGLGAVALVREQITEALKNSAAARAEDAAMLAAEGNMQW